MSHVVKIETQIKDIAGVRAACTRLKLKQPEQGTFKLFSGAVTGWAVQLPDWTYPVVCNVTSGDIKFDNFGGRWGDQKELDRFLQAYAVEKARIEARRKGHTVTERKLDNGAIKLTIQVTGGAA